MAATCKLYPPSIRVRVGETKNVTAAGLDSGVRNDSATFSPFSSTDTGKATLSSYLDCSSDIATPTTPPPNLRTVTGVAAGTCQINATYSGAAATPIDVLVDNPAASPVAVITESNQTVYTGQAVEYSADSSTGVDQVLWNWGDGDTTKDWLGVAHSYRAAGIYTVTLTITNSSGVTSQATVTVTVTNWPAPTATFNCTTAAQILTAYNSCTGGEEIVIPAGTVITSEFVLPAKTFSDFVTIRTDGTLPARGVRIGPSDTSQLVTFIGNGVSVTSFALSQGTEKIRLVGLKFEPFYRSETAGDATYYTCQIGRYDGATYFPSTTADNPENIVLDHCLINPPDDVTMVHGCLNDGWKVGMNDCWFGNIKTYGSQDSQAVVGLNGLGGHAYNNCYLEGVSENVIYGGGTPTISGLVSRNIEFRRCYFYTRTSWKGLTGGPLGETINEKNIFEIKNGRRGYLEGCIFKHQWDADRSQIYPLVFKTAETGGSFSDKISWAITEEWTLENCLVDDVYCGLDTAVDSYNTPFVGLPVNNIRLRNVGFTGMEAIANAGTAESQKVLGLTRAEDFYINHVTFVRTIKPTSGTGILISSNNCRRLTIINSIMPMGDAYAVFGVGGRLDMQGLNYGTAGTGGSISAKDSDASWTVNKNVMPYSGDATNLPNFTGAVNAYPAAQSNVGYVGGSNYRLDSSSTYKNYASDGTDPGANWDTIDARTITTVSGEQFSTARVNRVHHILKIR